MAERSADTDSKAPASDPFLLCGTTIANKYRVGAVVGKGGFGVVYRGVHTGFGEPIAVKCLRIDPSLEEDKRQQLLNRLQDEGRVLHRLSRLSNSIVQALDVGAVTTAGGQWVPYLVLEWLDGETLAEHLRKRREEGEAPYTVQQALKLLAPAAEALALAHQQKVAHRDVKPDNLYLTQVGGRRMLKVLDFGIAKVLSEQAHFTAAAAATKQQQATAFTPSYGAPEQFNKKRGATGPWTDVFALALILVEMVSGERALSGDDATQLYIAAADPSSRPTPRYHGVEISDAVERVIAQALSVEPAERYQHAGAFWQALAAAVDDDGGAALPAVSDVSETGEFVSRHDLMLGAAEAAAAPTSVRPTAPSAPPQSGGAPDRATTTPSASAGGDEVGAASQSRDATATLGQPLESVRGVSGSPGWLPLVVVAALAGAAGLFWKLRHVGSTLSTSSSGASPTPTLAAPSAAFTASPRVPASSANVAAASASAGPDAGGPALAGGGGAGGIGGGATGAGGQGGQGGAPVPVPVTPPGMALIQPPIGAPTKAFFLDRSEVSLAAFRECVMAGRCVRATRIVLTPASAGALGVKGITRGTKPEQLAEAWGGRCNEVRQAVDDPVNCVNHATAVDYCRFRDKRLPTSDEWTLAAAGDPPRRFPWGDAQPECSTACFGLNGSCIGHARQVASCKIGARRADVTPQGIVDLGGNLSEWVQDAGKRPNPAEPAWRLLRGGNFGDEASWLPVVKQRQVPPVTAHVTIGFRCAKDVR